MLKICPNIHTQDWNDLVIAAGGELLAQEHYIKNNHNIPIVNEDGDIIYDETKVVVPTDQADALVSMQVQSSNYKNLATGKKTVSFRAGTGLHELQSLQKDQVVQIKIGNQQSNTFVQVKEVVPVSNFSLLTKSQKNDFAVALGYDSFADFEKKGDYATDNKTTKGATDIYDFINGKVSGVIVSYEKVAALSEDNNDMSISAETLNDLSKITSNLNVSFKDKFTKYAHVLQEGKGSIKKHLDDVAEVIKDLESANVAKGITTFISKAEAHSNALLKKVREPDLTINELKDISDFAESYSIVDDVDKFLTVRETDFLTAENQSEIEGAIKNVKINLDKVKAIYQDKGINALAVLISEKSERGLRELKLEYHDKYNAKFPNVSNVKATVRKEMRDKWVNEQLLKNHEINQVIILNKIRERLKRASFDLGKSAWVVGQNSINDEFIQYLVNVLDEAEFEAKEKFGVAQRELMKVRDKYVKGKTTDQEVLYEGVYESKVKKDDKGNTVYDKKGKAVVDKGNYYVREAYHEWYDARERYDAVTFDQTLSKEEISKIQYSIAKEHLSNVKRGWSSDNIKSNYKNPQFDKLTGEKKDVYDALIKFNEASDALVPLKSRLGYKLPSINKDTREIISTEGLVAAGKHQAQITGKVESDNYQYGVLDSMSKVPLDTDGKMLKEVPMMFRGTPENQSYDLFGMALSNRFVSLNHNEKSKAKVELEILKDLIAGREVAKKVGGMGFLSKQDSKMLKMFGFSSGESKEILEDAGGLGSNTFKIYDEIMSMRLYGRNRVKSNMKILGKDVDALADAASAYTANRFMLLNATGGAVNFMQGKWANYMEGIVGRSYSAKDIVTGDTKYWKDFKNNISDVGEHVSTSRTNLFLHKLVDSSMDFSGMSNNLVANSKLKNLFDIKSGHGISSIVEHQIQAATMYAVLQNIKAVNSKGEFINAEGEVVEREDALPIDEAYDVVDGNLKLKEGFHPEISEFKMNKRVKAVLEKLHGNYNQSNKSVIERYVYGRLGAFMRKWLVPGFQKRWRNITYGGTALADIPMEQRILLDSEEGEIEGSYTSAVRFLRFNFNNIRKFKLQVMANNWGDLTDMEKSNIRTTLVDLLAMHLVLVSGMLLKGLADEEDEEWLYAIAYLQRRLYSEMVFYTGLNPSDTLNTLKTPAVTMSSVELIIDTSSQLMEDVFWNLPTTGETEKIKSGHRKGDSKLGRGVNKLTNPYYIQIADKNFKESLKVLDQL